MTANGEGFYKISDFLSKEYPAVARLLRDTCTEGSLGTRGRPGTTFLCPQDPQFVKRIEDLVKSPNSDDVQLASDHMSMLIVRDHFLSGADWKNKEPITALGQVLEVASAGSREVTFKSGAKATLETRFVDGSKGKNIAVWKLSGEIPITSDKFPSGKPAKTGGYLQSDDESKNLRNRIMHVVENEFAESLGASGEPKCDPFIKNLFSLINWCRYMVDDKTVLYQRVLPLLCLDRVDLYFLVEPHKPAGQTYLLDDSIIAKWWAGRYTYYDIAPMQTCSEFAESLAHPEGADDSMFYTDRAGLLRAIAALRSRMISAGESRPRTVIDQIHKQYLDLAATNTLNGGKVFPTPLADYYKQYDTLKMIQDELRFITHWKFTELCQCSSPDYADLNNLFNVIGEMLYTSYAGKGKSGQRLLNIDTIKYSITPTETIEEVKIFINSSAFMHVAMTPAEHKSMASKQSSERPKSSKILYNIGTSIAAQHQRLVDYRDSSSAVARLLLLDPSVLTEEEKEKLRKKFAS